jgi:hypothetical protein
VSASQIYFNPMTSNFTFASRHTGVISIVIGYGDVVLQEHDERLTSVSKERLAKVVSHHYSAVTFRRGIPLHPSSEPNSNQNQGHIFHYSRSPQGSRERSWVVPVPQNAFFESALYSEGVPPNNNAVTLWICLQAHRFGVFLVRSPCVCVVGASRREGEARGPTRRSRSNLQRVPTSIPRAKRTGFVFVLLL